MVEILVGRGTDVNARCNDGRTPLAVQAVEAEGYEVMKALLKSGADPKQTDDRGQSALDILRARQEGEKIELLIKYGAG
jgi:ankyrin repeat protein